MPAFARVYQVCAAINMLLVVARLAEMTGARALDELIGPALWALWCGGWAVVQWRMYRRFKDDDDDDDFGRLIPIEDGV